MKFCEKYSNRVNTLIVEDMDFASFPTPHPFSYYANKSELYKT